jgi:hypothetical protein
MKLEQSNFIDFMTTYREKLCPRKFAAMAVTQMESTRDRLEATYQHML